MQLSYTDRFLRSYKDAPLRVQKQCDKQLALLAQDLRHPSLRAKKYNEARDVWQGRVNASWRFYFKIDGDLYSLIDIIPHPK
jgi:mRNA-degrading endonuclease RelE of RelBE toxin-antitoxin system